MRIIRILETAAVEAAEAAAWYEQEHSGLGLEFQYAIESALDLLEGDEILIIAFAHFAKRPGYWRSRLAV